MKKNSTLPRSQELEPHYQIQFRVIPKRLLFWWGGGSYPSAGDTVNIF